VVWVDHTVAHLELDIWKRLDFEVLQVLFD
jgi:hypothetical protein